MRILVTGSRNYNDPETIADALLLTYAISDAETTAEVTVVHGGAYGADSDAGKAAREWGMVEEIHPAVWRPFGIYNPQAGLLRNQKMVSLGADICLAFIRDGSAGASDCARRAEAAGIETIRYEA
jgi:hypothetical protein